MKKILDIGLDLEGRGRGFLSEKTNNAPILLGLGSFFRELKIISRKNNEKNPRPRPRPTEPKPRSKIQKCSDFAQTGLIFSGNENSTQKKMNEKLCVEKIMKKRPDIGLDLEDRGRCFLP